jgi:putative SOS response-associated peptidase YedK
MVEKGAELQALLRPYPAEAMTAYPVGLRVNSPRNNDADCVAPLTV